MFRFVAIGSIAIIIILSVYFNMPKSNQPVASADITADIKTVPPDLKQISGYINTAQITHLSQEKGNVVLLHFWRFGCPECVADMSFINSLYQKYHQFGLVILGIHSPESDNEKDYNNILNAVHQFQIKYPVLIDNSRATWNSYGDSYWPRDALIGKSGFERFTHIGTGDEQQIENNIRYLLTERNVP